jgi:hypothetical protein
MDRVKRLCPECGAANPVAREYCQACGASLRSNLPVPVGERLPVPWKEVGTSLAVGAGVWALRAGVRLARHLVARQLAKSTDPPKRDHVPLRRERPLSRRAQEPQTPLAESRVRVWGRRVRGTWRSDGSRQVETEEFYWQADDTAR